MKQINEKKYISALVNSKQTLQCEIRQCCTSTQYKHFICLRELDWNRRKEALFFVNFWSKIDVNPIFHAFLFFARLLLLSHTQQISFDIGISSYEIMARTSVYISSSVAWLHAGSANQRNRAAGMQPCLAQSHYREVPQQGVSNGQDTIENVS